jgi:exodeoxyribonuclease V alpha subunit
MDTALDPVTGIFSGALIMVTRNDYGKDIYNGDVGVVIRNTDGGFRAHFQHGGEYHDFAVGQLPNWEMAFALTVHKSQGSEFDDVLLVLPEDPEHRLLTREILYTGVTRARKRVIIYGQRQAIKTAVSRKIARQSGLVWESQLAS